MGKHKRKSRGYADNSTGHESAPWYASKSIDYIVVLIGIIIAAIFRIAIPWQSVMTGNILFSQVDAYYLLRIADQYPNIPAWDFFYNYPVGVATTAYPVWSIIIAVTAQIFNITVSQAGAILPAVLGILTIIPVYIICRALFRSKIVAVIAIILLAIIPGEFLGRTQLGAADYHCLETLLLTTIMMFIILAVKNIANKKLLVAFSIPALACIALYLMAWAGALLVIFILGVCIFIKLMQWCKNWKYRTAIILAILFLVSCAYINNPLITVYTIMQGMGFFIWNLKQATSEEMPLLFTLGQFGITPLWNYFGIAFYAYLVGLGIFGYRYIKYRKNTDLIFLVWVIVAMLITFAKRRFAYYFAINVSILAGYGSYMLIYYISRVRVKQKVIVDKFRAWFISLGLAAIILIPMVQTSVAVVADKQNYMSQGWIEATTWLKSQSNEKTYYSGDKDYETGGVMSWWDYGYWIVREGHMPVLCSPGMGDRVLSAMILTADNETFPVAAFYGKELKYLVIDYKMILTKLYAELYHAEMYVPNYFEIYNYKGVSRTLLKPAIYELFAVRMYMYDGVAIKSQKCPVFTVQDHEITAINDFATYGEAAKFIGTDSNKFVAGIMATEPPIDIEAIEHFKLVYQSDAKVVIEDKSYSEVKIFEHIGKTKY